MPLVCPNPTTHFAGGERQAAALLTLNQAGGGSFEFGRSRGDPRLEFGV